MCISPTKPVVFLIFVFNAKLFIISNLMRLQITRIRICTNSSTLLQLKMLPRSSLSDQCVVTNLFDFILGRFCQYKSTDINSRIQSLYDMKLLVYNKMILGVIKFLYDFSGNSRYLPYLLQILTKNFTQINWIKFKAQILF